MTKDLCGSVEFLGGDSGFSLKLMSDSTSNDWTRSAEQTDNSGKVSSSGANMQVYDRHLKEDELDLDVVER